MYSSKKDSLPSPILEESFFPFSSSNLSSSHRIMAPADDLLASPQDDRSPTLLEKDLILAAEVGQALLEKNEELAAQLEQMEREMEATQQEKHIVQRRLDVRDLEASQREAELQADITALSEQLDQKHLQSRDRRREESEQLTQLSNHNQKLVEQLAEAVALEHTLRSELRTLREEMEDTSFSKSISSARLDSLQAENRVLKERCAHMDDRLKSAQEDNDRLRSERDELRERVMELQTTLKDKDTELEQEHSIVFQLRTLNRTLQQKVEALGEEASLGEATCFPLSLQSEIQQSQAKETILAHSAILQVKEEEIQRLQEELHSRETELEKLRVEIKPFRNSPGKPAYSALEEETILARQERDALNQQLLNTIKHKVALSQEVESWQEDMRLVICHQVQLQQEEREKHKEEERTGFQRGTRTSRSLRVRGEDGRKSFFSSLFGSD
ncbi:BICD family-like cargo adapter 2 isoform X1 [Triplophysa dalaica]|uniref:BICD family-like cargo adapter 2 isoform X1 n=1 Tax=Triplophysa dalaica TaxID=1582913 RepID=UPI0024DFFF7A|nr:BICD family-like cargo adapter 2 isoform X1 [Triplophysa dalaica]XP_056602721.1 BICD family-like cargo adapter 2 isoform X1 [Triplophysa dalaica]